MMHHLIKQILEEETSSAEDRTLCEDPAEGEFFCLAGSENLGVTDIYKGDGFDLIHQHGGQVHLSDISPEEEETSIPKGSKKVKKTVLKPRLDKGPFNITPPNMNEGIVITPIKVDGKLVSDPNIINEETDIFGQGLMDPIEPQKFEGSDEEWEELVKLNNRDLEDEDVEYEYTGGKTDPSTGFVAPSKEVTDNICKVKGFCKAQGPITFGQLKELVEAATSKRIQADMGRGAFKTLWRIVPFFVPQILLPAIGVTITRAFNKLVTPALKDTRGYKEWWGKAVLKAMDIAEGDYIPDLAMGDDPISKVFFISDGLLQMIKDKYKIKFARYVADVAASKPDGEPVPDWFVDNLLRDYLNQKFLLDPPLPIKSSSEQRQDLQEGFRDAYATEEDRLTSLNVDEEYFYEYLDENWRDKVTKELNYILECFSNYCSQFNGETYDGSIGLEARVIHEDYCSECDESFHQLLGSIDNDLIKLGMIDEEKFKAPFPYAYNEWMESIIQEIDSSFFINQLGELDMYVGAKEVREDLKNWGYDNDKIGPLTEEEEETAPDRTPFTPRETTILKALHKNFTQLELKELSEETPETYRGGTGKKFWNLMKLFGIEHQNSVEEDTRSSLYAKWAYDNWTEDGDYGSIEEPIKEKLKWYDVERHETGSQVEYKSGYAEVLGFDEDDASNRADYDFYSWGGEMETDDWGDYEAYDSHIENINFNRLDEQDLRMLTPRDRKILELTKQIFDILNENFILVPFEEGEINNGKENLGLYSFQHDGIVPLESIYNPIQPLLDKGIEKEEVNIFIKVITDWINSKMFPQRNYDLNEGLNDLIYRDEPKDKHIRRMNKDWGELTGFPIDKFKTIPPPENESKETEKELKQLDSILVDDEFVESADDVDKHFKNYLDSKNLEYPKELIKKYMPGVRSIILKLKYYYNRPRPGQVAQAKGMDTFDPESLKSASTPSYPSGHATQGRFIGRILGDIYPDHAEQLKQIGDDIAYSRNMAKVHYPSDSKFGQALGDALYDYVGKPEMELELDEWCPMGNPNKCTQVTYKQLPDTLHEQINKTLQYVFGQKVRISLAESFYHKNDKPKFNTLGFNLRYFQPIRKSLSESQKNFENLLTEMKKELEKSFNLPKDLNEDTIREIILNWYPKLVEQQFPFNPDNKKKATSHPKGEPDWSIRRGRQHYAMNVEDLESEPVTALNNYLVKNSPFNFLGFDYYLSAVPARMPDQANIDVFVPMLDTGRNADELWNTRFTPVVNLDIHDEKGPYLESTSEFLHQIRADEKWPEYYMYDEVRDEFPDQVKTYEERESDYINTPGAIYNKSWKKREDLLEDELVKLGKLFGLEQVLINRQPFYPWKRKKDSYGNEDIRPGETVPRVWPRPINEQTARKVSPELEIGDTIIVVNRSEAPPGVREPFPEHEPELFVSYTVTHKENTGHKAKHPYHYFLLPEEQFEIFLDDPYDDRVDKHEKSLFPWIHEWILDKEYLDKFKEEDHEMSMEDFNDVGEVLRNPKKVKEIYDLLLEMFPNQKEVIDYNYKNDAFAEMKRFIHGIDKYKLIGPVVVQPEEMKLAPDVESEIEKKFQQFGKGEINQYFRTDKTDPSKVDVSQFPPITIDEEGFVSDGNHRAFIAKKQNKPLKTYKYITAKNNHPNVTKILKLIGREEDIIREQKESNLNPKLMIGDEITVVDVDKSYGTLHTPELFKNYVVTGIKHRQPENWESPMVDTKYYEITPIGETQEQRLGRMLAGGGMVRREQLHPTDSWVLRKGFLRGEYLSEHTETKKLNPELMRGDEILVVSHGYERAPNKGPELYKPYQVVSIKQSNDTQETYYGLYPLEDTDDNLLASIRAGGGIPTEIILYKVDNWILRPGFRRGEHLSEQEENKIERISPTLQKVLKNVLMMTTPTVSGQYIRWRDFTKTFRKYIANEHIEILGILWLVLRWNQKNLGYNNMLEMLSSPTLPQEFSYPSISRFTVQHLAEDYSEETWEEECTSDGYGDETSEECECLSAERYNEETDEWEDCEFETDGSDECECNDWERKEYQVYGYPEAETEFLMVNDDTDIQEKLLNWDSESLYYLSDFYSEVNENDNIILNNPDDTMNWDHVEYEKWDYFEQGREGEIQDVDEELIDVDYEMSYLNNQFSNPSPKDTLSEQVENVINPDLDVGDLVRVLEIDGEHARMPERFVTYKVVEAKQDQANHEFYYDIVPIDLDYDTVRTFDSKGTPIFHTKTLYRGDTWMKLDNKLQEQEHKYRNPEVQIGDIVQILHVAHPDSHNKKYVGSKGIVKRTPENEDEKHIAVDFGEEYENMGAGTIYPMFKIKEKVLGDLYLRDGSPEKVWVDRDLVRVIPQTINEQDEQLSLFPTGDWDFPVGFEDYTQENGEVIHGHHIDQINYLKKKVSEPIVKQIFKMWDRGGIDFNSFKLLGLPYNRFINTFILKRYIQNTRKPIPVEMTFDCHDLKDLFDRGNRNYNMDYIGEYLCGQEEYWDSQDWYNYEWENYLADQIDEKNWETISEIFGGVPQNIAEDILTRTSSSEEVDDLIEKYEDEIDDIRSYIVWALNDETEYATKKAMGEDIKEKILDHFGGGTRYDGSLTGNLYNDDNGKFVYKVEADLRDIINDEWDNTEDVFEFHEDYSNTTLEDMLLDLGNFNDYNIPNYIFGEIMKETFSFWSYCEGRQGDCLEADTKFFDGYWYPDVNINDSLADRLPEMLWYDSSSGKPKGEGESKPTEEQFDEHLLS